MNYRYHSGCCSKDDGLNLFYHGDIGRDVIGNTEEKVFNCVCYLMTLFQPQRVYSIEVNRRLIVTVECVNIWKE
jgi:hypothetical protein